MYPLDEDGVPLFHDMAVVLKLTLEAEVYYDLSLQGPEIAPTQLELVGG